MVRLTGTKQSAHMFRTSDAHVKHFFAGRLKKMHARTHLRRVWQAQRKQILISFQPSQDARRLLHCHRLTALCRRPGTPGRERVANPVAGEDKFVLV